MISITCNKELFNSLSEKILKNNLENAENILNSLMPTADDCIQAYCPKCHMSMLKLHSSYERNVIFAYDSGTIALRATVTRVICSNCHSTHALLPDFIVPNKQYSSQAIVFISSYALNNSIDKAADKFDVDHSEVFRFTKMSYLMLNYTANLFNFYSIPFDSTTPNISIFKNLPDNFSQLFFFHYKFPFFYFKSKRKLFIGFHKLSI